MTSLKLLEAALSRIEALEQRVLEIERRHEHEDDYCQEERERLEP